MPFSPKIYKKAVAARVKDNMLLNTNELDNPREITAVSTLPTNHMKSEIKMVMANGIQYTSVDLIVATPLAILGLYKKQKKADANNARAKA